MDTEDGKYGGYIDKFDYIYNQLVPDENDLLPEEIDIIGVYKPDDEFCRRWSEIRKMFLEHLSDVVEMEYKDFIGEGHNLDGGYEGEDEAYYEANEQEKAEMRSLRESRKNHGREKAENEIKDAMIFVDRELEHPRFQTPLYSSIRIPQQDTANQVYDELFDTQGFRRVFREARLDEARAHAIEGKTIDRDLQKEYKTMEYDRDTLHKYIENIIQNLLRAKQDREFFSESSEQIAAGETAVPGPKAEWSYDPLTGVLTMPSLFSTSPIDKDDTARERAMSPEQLKEERELSQMPPFVPRDSKIGIVVFLLLYIFAWKRAHARVNDRYRILVRTAPEMVYWVLFGVVFLDMSIAVFIVIVPMVLWNLIFVFDSAGMIGLDRDQSSVSIVMQQATRSDMLMLFAYVGAATWVAAYAYTYMLHSTRAPVRRYKQMADHLFYFNLVLTVCCLVAFMLVAH